MIPNTKLMPPAERWPGAHFRAFAGARLTNSDDAENRAIAGVRYRLPYMVWSSLTLDSAGEARLTLAKTLQLTSLLSAFAKVEYDTGTEWKWTTGAGYTLTKALSLTTSYSSDYGFSGGVALRFSPSRSTGVPPVRFKSTALPSKQKTPHSLQRTGGTPVLLFSNPTPNTMKTQLALLLAATGLLLTSCASNGSPTAAGSVKPYPEKTCIVTGNALGSMGPVITQVHEGQEVKFCGKPCVKKFAANPAKYMAGL